MHVATEYNVIRRIIEQEFNVIIIDASAVKGVPLLVSRIRAQCSSARIIVMTASPTWRRAREAFEAGAMDYIRKSLDKNELLAIFSDILAKPVPH